MLHALPVRVAALATVALFGIGAADAPPPVCERLSQQIGLKPAVRREGGREIEEWRIDNASLGQHLFGGTVATSIGLEPQDGGEMTGDDYRRMAAMCERTKKGAECRVAGPAVLKLGMRRGAVSLPVADGERPLVGIRGTTVYCRRA